jgi:CBS domain-containing protein
MPRTTPVRDVMTTDVLTFRPEDPIQEASQRLVERDVDGAPVVDDQGRVVGMFTTDDLLKFEEDLRRAVAATVADVMHDDPVSCGPDDTLERVATVMHEEKLGRLPVIEGGRLIGIVARGDILRSIMAAPGE